MKPRAFQRRAIDAIFDYFRNGGTGNPLVCLPGASGKSVVQATFAHEAIGAYPNTRILCVTHVKELIEQNHERMHDVWSDAPTGIYSASVGRREAQAQILFCGIQTVYDKAQEIGWVDLLLIDEAHLLPESGDGQYQTFIKALRVFNPHLKVIGFTATPYRQGQGLLTEGKNAIFTDIIIDLTQGDELVALIDQGFLSPLHPKETDTRIDVSHVKKVGGDFNQKQLEQACNQSTVTSAAVREALAAGVNRASRLWFCAGVAHATAVRDEIRSFGLECEIITGATPKAERKRIIGRFKSGALRDLVNANVLTTGFDHPRLDMIVVLRPTDSASLHVQINARGMRVVYAPGFDLSTQAGRLAAIAAGPKQDCLVFDFAGNTARLGPINAIRIPKKRGDGKGTQGPPTKTCPGCKEIVAAAARTCASCGFEFPPPAPELYHTAATDKLIVRAEDLIVRYSVDSVRYSLHQPPGKRQSLKVTYECGLESFNEWVTLGYDGFAGSKAANWWMQRSPKLAPMTVDAALPRTDELDKPLGIHVSFVEKHPRVVKYEWA